MPYKAEGGKVKGLGKGIHNLRLLKQRLLNDAGAPRHFDVPFLVSPVTPEDIRRFIAIAREYDRKSVRVMQTPDMAVAWPASAGLHEEVMNQLSESIFGHPYSQINGEGGWMRLEELLPSSTKRGGHFNIYDSTVDDDQFAEGGGVNYADGGKVGTVRQLAQAIRNKIARGKLDDHSVRMALSQAADQADVPVTQMYQAVQDAVPEKITPPPAPISMPVASSALDHPLVASSRSELERLIPREGFRPSGGNPADLEAMSTLSMLANRTMDRANVEPTMGNFQQLQEVMRQLHDLSTLYRQPKAEGGKVRSLLDVAGFAKRRASNEEMRRLREQFKDSFRAKGGNLKALLAALQENAQLDDPRVAAQRARDEAGQPLKFSDPGPAPAKKATGGKVRAVHNLFQVLDRYTGKPLPGSYADESIAQAQTRRNPKTPKRYEVQPMKKARGGPIDPKRKRSQSLGTVSQLAAAAGRGDGRRRKRLMQGIMSQLYALDADGNPTFLTGRPTLNVSDKGLDVDIPTPGIINEVLALPTLLETLGLGEAPRWAHEASDEAEQTARRVQQDMGLGESQGFDENFDVALGTMLAQIPVPTPKKVTKAGKLIEQALESAPGTLALGPLEYIMPTIQPSLKNYLSGGLGGGLIREGQDLLGSEPAE